jgi:predicted ABC-type ATPase
MTSFSILSDEFTHAAFAAWERARAGALQKGHPVFYQGDDGRYILERPDGKKFEIRFFACAPRDSHFEVVCELPATAA